jgi:Ca2+-binding RTX toxin-like protein
LKPSLVRILTCFRGRADSGVAEGQGVSLRTPHRISTAFAVSIAIVLVSLVAPSLAAAGTARLDDPDPGAPHLTFTAANGEANRLVVFFAPGGYRVIDLGEGITAGSGCAAVSSSEVFCAFDDTFAFTDAPKIDVLLGDLNDFASVAGTYADEITVDGEAGADELELGAGCELSFDAPPCDVVLLGGPGDDMLQVLDGRFRMDGGTGGDVMKGNGIVDYRTRVDPVIVDSDGIANDGEAGEGDNIGPGFLTVLGGSAGDTFTGVNADGGGGNDTFTAAGHGHFFDGQTGDDAATGSGRGDSFRGGPRADELNGGGGPDDLLGGGGGDTLRGGPGGDVIFAEAGNDHLWGGDGRDFLRAGAGDDVIRARDGLRDRMGGGRGSDRARVDRRLDVTNSIEAFF